MAGAQRKSMSAMPIPATMVPISFCRSAWSHLTESVPSRLYGVSKSNLPLASASPSAAAAAGPLRREIPEPTAPARVVNPAPRRNDLRLRPVGGMAVLLTRHTTRSRRRLRRNLLAGRDNPRAAYGRRNVGDDERATARIHLAKFTGFFRLPALRTC